jgi:uncharacterized RDD family membrane protein YckC
MSSEPVAAAPPALASAWARYWARSLDVLLWLLVLCVLFGMLAPRWLEPGVDLDARLTDQIVAIILLPFAMAGDALLYAGFGNTPGKWLAGLAVRDAHGGRLTPLRYLTRNARVYASGLAFGVCLVAFFVFIHQYRRVRGGRLTSWDEGLDARVFKVRGGILRTGIAAALYLTLSAGGIAVGQYFGNMTPEQQLQFLASGANPDSPTMIDEHLRLDRVYVAPGRVLEYDYTVLGVSADDPGFGARLERAARPDLVREFCTELTMVADAGGSVRWRYADSGGQLLDAIEVSKQDCAARR